MDSQQRFGSGQNLGPYKIIRKTGEGGMGEVYEAVELGLNRRVALKMIRPEDAQKEQLLKRFQREGRALAKINHPNVVTVYNVGEADGQHYIAMEYVEGVSLRHVCRHYILSSDEAIPIFKKLCAGLFALHSHLIIHRDIKPSNIILRPDGEIKIVDFGIAKLIDDEGSGHTTKVGHVLGTIRYMAPEVASGLPSTIQSDIWATGAIFYEMMTGQLLINAPENLNSLQLLEIIRNFKFHFPTEARSWVNPDVLRIVQKMCVREVKDRYATVKEILEEFDACKTTPPHPSTYRSFVQPVPNLEACKKELINTQMSEYMARRIVTLAVIQNKDFLTRAAGSPTQEETMVIDHSEDQSTTLTENELSAAVKIFKEQNKKNSSLWKTQSEAPKPEQTRSVVAPDLAEKRSGNKAMAVAMLLILASSAYLIKLAFFKNSTQKPMPLAVAQKPFQLLQPKVDERLWLGQKQKIDFQWQPSLDPKLGASIKIYKKDGELVLKNAVEGSSIKTELYNATGPLQWLLVDSTNEPISETYEFTVLPLPTLTLTSPARQEKFSFENKNVNFMWQSSSPSNQYRLQVSPKKDFSEISKERLTEEAKIVMPMESGTWFWRVQDMTLPSAARKWSAIHNFSVDRPVVPALTQVQPSPVVTPKVSNKIEPTKPLAKKYSLKLNNSSENYFLKKDEASIKWDWDSLPAPSSLAIKVMDASGKILVSKATTQNHFEWSLAVPGVYTLNIQSMERESQLVPFKKNFKVFGTPPKVARITTLQALSGRDVASSKRVMWESLANVTQYLVEWSQDELFSSILKQEKTQKAETLFPFSEGIYYYRVSLLDRFGNKVSSYSSPGKVSFKISQPIAAPELRYPPQGANLVSANGQNPIIFSWSTGPDVAHSVIEVSRTQNFARPIFSKKVKGSRYTLQGKVGAGTYYWRIQTVQMNNETSQWSSPRQLKID